MSRGPRCAQCYGSCVVRSADPDIVYCADCMCNVRTTEAYERLRALPKKEDDNG